MILFQAVELIVTLIETVIGELIIAGTMYEGKIKWKYSITGAVIIALAIWGVNQFQLFSVAASIIAIVGYTVSACCIYKGKARNAMVVAADYVILIYIVDFFVISVLGVLFQENQMAAILTNSFSFKRILFLVLSKGILIAVYIIFSKYFSTAIRIISRKMWIWVSFIIICVYCFVERTLTNTDIDAFFVWILLLALAVLAMYSFMQYVSYTNEKARIAIAEEGNQQMKENYETLVQCTQDNQIFYHDLKNHYLIIDNYLNRGEYEMAREYMKEVKCSYSDVPVSAWTGISALDTLIQCKKKRAEFFGIDVDINANRIQLRLAEHEMITLLGNALDNAIEACRKNEKNNRWIRVSIRKIRDMTFIKVVNACQVEPNMEERHFVTSKSDKAHHGFGTLSMQLIVDKYEGTMSANYENGIFSLLISFFE